MMRGHIVKRYNKRYKNNYSIVLDLGTDPATGKRKQQWISFKGTKRDAEKRLSELLHQLDTGTFMKPGKTTLAEFLDRWIEDYRPNLSPRGFDRYDGIVHNHLIPRLGRITLTQLKPEHIQTYYTEALNGGLSAATVQYHHSVLHVALQSALKRGLVNRNVADAVDLPKVRQKEMETWNEDEISFFLEAAKKTPHRALFYTSLYTGARRAELLALRWQDIDLVLGQMYITRNLHQLKDGSYIFTEPKSAKSKRMINLPPSLTIELTKHREKQEEERERLGTQLNDEDLAFSHLDGRPLRPNTITRAWKTLAIRCGLKPIRLHDARHSHASLLLKQAVHPKVVQERLGHSSINITLDRYSHVAPGLQEAAAARFDDLLNPKRENEAVEEIR